MQNQRIRYMNVGPNVLRSRRLFTTSQGQEVYVELDLDAKKYRVVDAVTGAEVTSGGNTRNKSVLKLQAKRGVTELGVSFGEEKRNRGGKTAE